MMKHSLFQWSSARAALALAAVMLLGLAGCTDMESRRGVPLEKTHWKLLEVEGVPASGTMGSRGPHIVFDAEKKRVTGYSGVNSFFGGYDTTSGGLRFSHMASTRMAGPPELMKFEDAFLKALAATRSYRITGDKLQLFNSRGDALARFQAQKNP